MAVVVAMMAVGQSVAARAVRDGFFLSQFPVSELPKMIVCGATLSVIVVLGTTHLLRQVAPARSVPWMFGASAVLFALEWLLALYQTGIAAIILYLHVMSLVALVASGYWSVVSERFDPHTAKRWIGHIGGGATLGGVLGGAAAWWGASRVDVASMILALAILNVCCALGVKQLGAGSRPIVGRRDEQAGGITILRQTPYLRNLALLVAAGAFCQACYDIVFKSRVAEHYSQGSELVAFFALFYMGLNVITFLVQNLLTRRCLQSYGLSFAVGTLPGSGLLLGGLAIFFPGLGTAIAMRGGIGVIENSTYRSGYELLYTPVLPHKKRPTKTIIDVGGEMSGGILGGVCAMAIFAVVPNIANGVLVAAGMLASAAGIYITRRIRVGYVNSLADSLEAGHIDLEEAAFGTAQRVLTAPVSAGPAEAVAADPSLAPGYFLRDALRDYMQERRRAPPPDSAKLPPWQYAPLTLADLPPPASEALDELTLAIVCLRSGNEQQIRRVLNEKTPLPAELVSVVLPLLDSPAVAEDAALALRRVAPAHIGALLDAIRSERNPMALRRSICDLLGGIPIQRCANGLLEFLDTDDLELRLRAASSLLRIRRANPELQIPRQRIFDLVGLEAGYCRRTWFTQASLDPRINATPPVETGVGRRVIQGVTYIFTLLLTVLEQQPTILAVRALAQSSAAQRGTAVEYIENVLPAHLLRELRPLLLDTRLALGKVSARSDILAELSRSRQSQADELAELRAHIDTLRGKRRSTDTAADPD
ncbi:MAG: hypothetical protein O7F73_07060 [Gammaproteobacteria bacterium]|nr:hypothetical protein [Gammaproteobacteria bacterium]